MPRTDSPASPELSPSAAAAKAERAERLAQALRDNLKRRKAQARGRSEADTDETPPGKPA